MRNQMGGKIIRRFLLNEIIDEVRRQIQMEKALFSASMNNG